MQNDTSLRYRLRRLLHEHYTLEQILNGKTANLDKQLWDYYTSRQRHIDRMMDIYSSHAMEDLLQGTHITLSKN